MILHLIRIGTLIELCSVNQALSHRRNFTHGHVFLRTPKIVVILDSLLIGGGALETHLKVAQ